MVYAVFAGAEHRAKKCERSFCSNDAINKDLERRSNFIGKQGAPRSLKCELFAQIEAAHIRMGDNLGWRAMG
jgi:hypothetical protein